MPTVNPRLRSEGILNTDDIAWCRTNGVELGYDPVQHGIVIYHCIDDIQPGTSGASTRLKSSKIFSGELVFRRWQEGDAAVFAALLDSDRLWTYMPDRRPEVDLAKALDLIRFSNEAEHHDVYAVEVGGEVVGQARLLFDLNAPARDTAEISYWLGEEYWGRGIGSRLVREFTRESFSRWTDVISIVARVHRENEASRQALLKAGYAPAGDGSTDAWQWYRITRS